MVGTYLDSKIGTVLCSSYFWPGAGRVGQVAHENVSAVGRHLTHPVLGVLSNIHVPSAQKHLKKKDNQQLVVLYLEMDPSLVASSW